MAISLVEESKAVSPDVVVNGWQVIKNAAKDYVSLINGYVYTPVGFGWIGDHLRSWEIWFCLEHEYTGNELECSYPAWYANQFGWVGRIMKRRYREASRACRMEYMRMFPRERFLGEVPVD
ncbi:MAG: hypothetical protein R3330_09945 [Saprospiraceae bacterium]|nr:hypothetical protein [Saprospiraceae bacterium]